MQSPIYASPAIRLTPTDCLDVHADDKAVVLGYLSARASIEIHAAPDYADQYADYIHAAAAASRRAREG